MNLQLTGLHQKQANIVLPMNHRHSDTPKKEMPALTSGRCKTVCVIPYKCQTNIKCVNHTQDRLILSNVT